MSRIRSTVLAAAAMLLAVLPDLATPAQAITGGERATDPAVVQILIHTRPQGEPHRCTGTVIAAHWVLTARHCITSDPGELETTPARVAVHTSNDVRKPGPAHTVDRLVPAKDTDLALLHLARPSAVKEMPQLSTSSPQNGEAVTLFGYGKGRHDVRQQWLMKASLTVVGRSDTVLGEPLLVLKGVTGTSNHGDSGGPVLDGRGRLIGVNVIGSHAAYEYPTEECKSVDVALHAAWIRSVIGR